MNKDYKSINNLWKDSEGYRYFGTLKLSSKIKYDGDDFIPLWEWINQLQQENKILKENAENNDKVVDKVNWENMLLKKENKQLNGAIQTYDILLKSNIEENQQLKIQISARETLCEEYEQLINTILNFDFFKEECPLNFSFEDNSKEDEAQNIFYNDEYCENNCNDIYKDCWIKYFKELQKAKGDDK